MLLSLAVMVTLNGSPLPALAGAETTNLVAVGLDTLIVPDAPVIELVTVSVAVMVCAPTVFSVAGKVPVPLVKVALPGSTAMPSVLVKCTVPE